VRNFGKVISAVVIMLSLSLLPMALPVVAVSGSINPQQFIPNPNIGFYTCSATKSCPMGVADYGVNGKNTYSYHATEFKSWANFTKLKINGDHEMTIQQNTVDYGVYEMGSKGRPDSGEYWIQDVPYITQSGGSYGIQLVDNIWNFSSTTAQMGGTIFPNLLGDCSQHGGQPQYYYCLGKQTITTTLPFQLEMVVTTGVLTSGAHSGSSYVTFDIEVYHSGTHVGGAAFDEVAFNGMAKGGASPWYQVGGKNPLKLFNDAETVLCGPGGGSSQSIAKVHAQLSEAYIAVGSAILTLVPHAWSAGTDTAETVSGVHVSSSVAGDGVASSGADNNNQIW
jgi:hypothetical protein